MSITHHTVLSAYNHAAALRFQHRHVAERLATLTETMTGIEELLNVLDRVTDIHDGIALEVTDNSVICVLAQYVWAKIVENDTDNTFTVVGWVDGTAHDVAIAFRYEDALARAKEFVSAHAPIG